MYGQMQTSSLPDILRSLTFRTASMAMYSSGQRSMRIATGTSTPMPMPTSTFASYKTQYEFSIAIVQAAQTRHRVRNTDQTAH